jgi:hypothetical protein
MTERVDWHTYFMNIAHQAADAARRLGQQLRLTLDPDEATWPATPRERGDSREPGDSRDPPDPP